MGACEQVVLEYKCQYLLQRAVIPDNLVLSRCCGLQASQGSAVPDVETIPGQRDQLKTSPMPNFPPASPPVGQVDTLLQPASCQC
jgi:hypothetical protein